LDSNYFAPGIQYPVVDPVVEYADTAQVYRGDAFLDSIIEEKVTKEYRIWLGWLKIASKIYSFCLP
jgi:hypothetical protein